LFSGSFASFQVASSEVKPFERNSALFVAQLDYGKSYCLSFWFRVRGSGNIDVKVQNVMVKRLAVRANSGWAQERVTLTPPGPYDTEARIWARIGGNQHGNVDVDDVEVIHGSC
jgi:hypothetical protein